MWGEVWQNDCNCEVTQKRLNGKKKWNVANSMDMFSEEDPNTICHYQIETNNAKGTIKFRFGKFISKGCTVTICSLSAIYQLFNFIKIDWVNNKIWPVVVLKYSTKVYLNFKCIFPQKSPSCHFLTYKLQWRDKVSWNLHLKDKVLSSVLDIWFSQKTYQVSHIAIKIARKHAFTTVVDQRNDGIFFMFLSTVCWINMESSKGKMYIRSSIGCIIL